MRSARAKIDRAEQYLEQLKTDIARDARDYGIECCDDFKTHEHVFYYVAPTPELTIEYGIIAGEVISQTRTALEHAVWEMVPIPDPFKTGLPVVWEQAKYQKKASRMLNGINNSAATIIEGLQPFNNGGTASLLYALDDMWNIDKHRTLNIVATDIVGLQRTYIKDGRLLGRLIGGLPNVHEDRAEAGRLPFPDFYSAEVEVVIEYGIRLEFRDIDAAKGKTVEAFLTQIIEFARGVVTDLSNTS